MAFWTKKKKKEQAQAAPAEVLYMADEGDTSSLAGEAPASTDKLVEGLSQPETDAVISEPLILQADSTAPDTELPEASESSAIEAQDSVVATKGEPSQVSPSTSAEPKYASDRRSLKAQKAAAKAQAKAAKADRKAKVSTDKTEIENWRKGAKGRPVQVFIGFLSNASKKDAVKYAIGVAETNAINVVNTAYAVFPWNGGWVYEVHEGGPRRAYLPAILRFFDAHGEHAKLDELVVTISTARRSVKVERTHSGLTAFLMPESFEGEQTPWLEPGPALKPAVPVRLGALAAGGAIFGTGFIAMLAAFLLRPEPPVVKAQRIDVPYDQLPISLWPTLLKASSSGYVSALQYSNGKYTFSIAEHSKPVEATVTPPPPVPAPTPRTEQ